MQATVSEWLENRIKTERSRDYAQRYTSIQRMLVSPRILAGVLPIKASSEAVTPTKRGTLEEKLIF